MPRTLSAAPRTRIEKRISALRLRRVVEGEAEGASLAVPADAPPVTRVNDLSAELAHAAQRGFHIRDAEVGKRHAVPRARSPLVHAQRGTVSAGLPALPFAVDPVPELDAQNPRPEATRPSGVIGGEFHQPDRRRHADTISEAAPVGVVPSLS